MEKTLLFIYNIHSGKSAIKGKMAGIIDIFTKAGYEVITYSTQGQYDAIDKVLEYADRADVIACAGGDGTINEIITGIMETKKDIPFLFLPAGSTNDYAMSFGISKNMIHAAEVAVNSSFRAIDIGRFNDRYFNYVAAFGLLTDISYATDQNLKNMLGYGAYVLEVSKRLFNIPALKMTIRTDDRVYKGEWFYGMVTNSTRVGGIKNITGSDVKFDDGIFEVTLVKATTNPIEFIAAVNSIASGLDSWYVIREKASRIEIESEESVQWTLDGENGGSHKNVVIEDIRQAVRIALPESANENLIAI